MVSKSIFEGPAPVAVPFKATPLKFPKKEETGGASPEDPEEGGKPPNNEEETPKPKTKTPNPKPKSADDLDEVEEMLNAKVDEAFDPKTGERIGAGTDEDDDEDAERVDAEEVEEEEYEGPSINDLFEAEWIVGVIEEARTEGYLKIYDWRGEIKQARKYFRYLSGIQSRTDPQQKAWEELDRFIQTFGDERDGLEQKIAWTEKFRQHLTNYLDHELQKLGDKRIPIWLYLIGMEGIALYRCGTCDTHLDELPFELPEEVPETNQKAPT